MRPTHGVLLPVEVDPTGRLVIVTHYGTFTLKPDGIPVIPEALRGLADDLNRAQRALDFCLSQLPEDYND